MEEKQFNDIEKGYVNQKIKRDKNVIDDGYCKYKDSESSTSGSPDSKNLFDEEYKSNEKCCCIII